ncbi:MAG: hypothetical protein LJF04_15125 [Gemmatimonadetes bacterium]|nr:hypothetical protein [Gemmatimonadota bacterium]
MILPVNAPGLAGARSLVDFVPLATTVVAAFFAPAVFLRWKKRRSGPHLLWWSFGIALFGVGTLAESSTTVFGWNEWVFRLWYISGAILGGAPLAQGTVYLMAARRTADRLTALLLSAVAVAVAFVILSPIDYRVVEPHRLTGSVMTWPGARILAPFINVYAAVVLIGGAAVSAWRFRSDPGARHRFVGNVFIAVGALLPGVGGTAARFGHVAVLYLTELVGLVLIWVGYRYTVRPRASGAPTVGRRIGSEGG